MIKVPTLPNEVFWTKYHGSYFKPYQVSTWHGHDHYQRYKKHRSQAETRRKLEEEGFDETNVIYRFNNYGFRTDVDFDIDNPATGSLFIGCSYTEGVGLNIEDCWAYKVAKKRGEAHYNLGQGGTGLETQYRLLKAWGPVLKPVAVFTLGAFEPRRELFHYAWVDKEMINVAEVFFPSGDNANSLIYKKYLSSPMETEMSSLRTFDAIKYLCKELNAELYTPDPTFHEEITYATRDNLARDLAHPGRLYHMHLAENLDKWVRVV